MKYIFTWEWIYECGIYQYINIEIEELYKTSPPMTPEEIVVIRLMFSEPTDEVLDSTCMNASLNCKLTRFNFRKAAYGK